MATRTLTKPPSGAWSWAVELDGVKDACLYRLHRGEPAKK